MFVRIFFVICCIKCHSYSSFLNSCSMCSVCCSSSKTNSSKISDEFDIGEIDEEVNTDVFKIVLFGDSNVGKSQIFNMYNDKHFEDMYIKTLGVDYIRRDIPFKSYVLYLWDSAGNEKVFDINKKVFKDTNVAIFCYDITNKISFNSINRWLNSVTVLNNNKSFLKVLCGTKKDLGSVRQVSINDGQKYAKDNNMQFFEVSAKTGEGIEDMFRCIIDKINNCNSDPDAI